MHQSTIKELISLSRQNDAQAFRQLVEAHQSMVYTLAFRLLCNDEDAKDVVQETFIKVWKHLDSFNTELKFSTWLYSITAHQCYDILKKAKHNSILRIDDQERIREFISSENLETTLINAELSHIITSLTRDLTPKQKLVFTLCDLEGLEVEEIKSITSLSAGKIKSNLYLARQYIRKRVENL
jgi:RNA polymerase sigma-70 factor (ECF subfamily)